MLTGRKINGIELKTQKRTHTCTVTWYLTKELKTSSGEKSSIFKNKRCWINWRSACRKMQIDPFLSPCTKFKSKWIKDLHIKQDTLKLIEEKVGTNLEYIPSGEKFLNRTPMGYALRIDKWHLIKLQSFCKAKDIVNRTIRQPTNWEKIFTNPTSNRGLISKYKFEYTKNSRS